MQVVQYLQNADVRGAPGTTAGQNKADTGAVGGWRRGIGSALSPCAARDRETQPREKYTEDPAKGPDRPC